MVPRAMPNDPDSTPSPVWILENLVELCSRPTHIFGRLSEILLQAIIRENVLNSPCLKERLNVRPTLLRIQRSSTHRVKEPEGLIPGFEIADVRVPPRLMTLVAPQPSALPTADGADDDGNGSLVFHRNLSARELNVTNRIECPKRVSGAKNEPWSGLR